MRRRCYGLPIEWLGGLALISLGVGMILACLLPKGIFLIGALLIGIGVWLIGKGKR